MQTVLDRLHLLPRYRQRVVFPPFGVAHPTWEDDPEVDIRNHVEEVELPAGADDQVMAEVAGRLYGQVLDRRRPLWKLILLQGRADGETAMLAMVHHAMVDGVSGVELQTVLHDLTVDAEPPTAPPASWQPEPLPDAISLLQDAVRDRLTDAARRWTDEFFRPFRPEQARQRMQQVTNALTSSTPYVLQPAPRTPFNGPISTERGFAWTELPFGEVREIRGALGGTVNDVVLAILSGALGRYLTAHGQRVEPNTELRAMCPVSVRGTDQRGALGNQVSMMIAPLYAGITDPVARLQAERGALDRL
jgi:WS/DGAT/MGAT family acyltransferase